jgi:hypothetical protein
MCPQDIINSAVFMYIMGGHDGSLDERTRFLLLLFLNLIQRKSSMKQLHFELTSESSQLEILQAN